MTDIDDLIARLTTYPSAFDPIRGEAAAALRQQQEEIARLLDDPMNVGWQRAQDAIKDRAAAVSQWRAAQERAKRAEAELAEARKDAEVWRHIAQEEYSKLRRARHPKETGYPIEGALDALFNGYRKHGRYSQVFCSQCGNAFLHHNYHGYSHCEDHEAIDAARERT